jgi:tetratricopeptide (TPR) repeat protein
MTMDGELDGALGLGEEILALGAESGINATGNRGRAIRRALTYTGKFQDALATLPSNPALLLVGGVMAGQRAYCLAYSGRREEAVGILKDFLTHLKSPSAHLSAVTYRYLLEAAVATGDMEVCREMFERTQSLAPYLITEAGMCFCMARHLGDAAAILNRAQEARRLYEQAVNLCSKARFRPELSLSRMGLAEVLLDHYPDEHDAAIEHLDFAIAEFREMKMQPSLERALGRRGLLKA